MMATATTTIEEVDIKSEYYPEEDYQELWEHYMVPRSNDPQGEGEAREGES